MCHFLFICNNVYLLIDPFIEKHSLCVDESVKNN